MQYYRNAIYICLLYTASMLFTCCITVTEDQALTEFKRENPNAIVIRKFVGEGDADNVYYHFHYINTPEKDTLEQVWLYQHQTNNSWKATWKGKYKIKNGERIN